MAEKLIRQLPSLRVSDAMEAALMRLAAKDDRTLSDYIRMILERHVFGHGASLSRFDTEGTDFGALQHDAGERGGRD